MVENLLAMDNDTLLLIDEDELVVQERVGAGAYGDVFRAKWHGKVRGGCVCGCGCGCGCGVHVPSRWLTTLDVSL